MADFPTPSQLTAFSNAVRDVARDFHDGVKGPPMVLDGEWRTYRTIKMRYVDLCKEYDLERFRTGREPYPVGGQGLAATPER